jgi:signal transduction histidine kinase
MQGTLPLTAGTELADAIFQAVITAGLAVFAIYLHRRQREPWLAWWAAAWGLYALRLVAIIAFLMTGRLVWLFAHQVATGWVALAILRAAMVFAGRTRWRRWYLALAAFPLLLALLAVNALDRFLLVALPMVVLISGVTIWTGVVFWRHARRTGSAGARFVAVAFVLWGLHHLDYPFLRARGAWVPWGYFLDVGFELAVGVGFALMVLSDTAARLAARTAELTRLQLRSTRAEEQTRRRLARDLHDETAQTLSAVKLEIGLLREGAEAGARERLDGLLALMDDGITGIRRVVADLRPAQLDDLGLASAIRSLATEVGDRSALEVTVDIDATLPRLDAERELGLFRAAQEAIANVIRHAEATRLVVRLRAVGDRVRLVVRDDGRGLAPDADLAAFEREGHLGLVGMRERIGGLGGTVRLDNSDGLTVTIDVPARSPG